jgi:hydrogenase/urease accessory protein HupE
LLILAKKFMALIRWCLLCFAIITAQSHAHLLPVQTGTINVINNNAYIALSIPITIFSGIDDNHDGYLEDDELRKHQQEIARISGERFNMAIGADNGVNVSTMLVPNPIDDLAKDAIPKSESLTVLLVKTFSLPPQSFCIATDLFGQKSAEKQITIKATQANEAEAAVLTKGNSSYCFFQSTGKSFLQYIYIGLEHILLGLDHLLFLATILIAISRFKQATVLLTSFTLAHCITYLLSTFGVFNVSSSIVEPAIALSIVLLGMLELFTKNYLYPNVDIKKVALIFCCGLLHGMGFASSMQQISLDNTHRVISIIGFNIGIELGQIIFACLFLILLMIAKRIPVIKNTDKLKKYFLLLVIFVGFIWFFVRLYAVG